MKVWKTKDMSSFLKNEYLSLKKIPSWIWPRIFYLSEAENSYLITSYIAGKMLVDLDLSNKIIYSISHSLKLLHSKSSPDIYNVKERLVYRANKSILRFFLKRTLCISEKKLQDFKIYFNKSIANNIYDSASESVSFIHWDLTHRNIKFDEKASIIDWECWSYDYREVDLVSFIYHNNLSKKQILYFLREYWYSIDKKSIERLTFFYVYYVFSMLSKRLFHNSRQSEIIIWINKLHMIIQGSLDILNSEAKFFSYHKLVHEEDVFSKTTLIDWTLWTTCNYSCSYCPEVLHNGSKPWVPKNIVFSIVENIIGHYKKIGQKYCFQFTGGEPTLHPDFLEIIKHIKLLGGRVAIISNASRTVKWWSEAVKYLDNINITYHWEFASKKHFLELIPMLSKETRVNINVTMDPNYFDERQEIVNTLSNLSDIHNISVTAKPLFINFWKDLYDYNQEQLNFLQWFYSHTQGNFTNQVRWEMKKVSFNNCEVIKPANIISCWENSWFWWQCNIWLELLVINIEGDIYKWHCKVGWKLGNIYTDTNFIFPTQGEICDKWDCNCAADIFTSKFRDA